MHNFRGDPLIKELVVVALLHDTVEDDKSFTLDMCAQQFGLFIAYCLNTLTKPTYDKSLNPKEKYELKRRYFLAIRRAHRVCKIVKAYDRINNVRCDIANGKTIHLNYITETKEFVLPIAADVGEHAFVELYDLIVISKAA